MSEALFYHNPKCSKSRKALDIIDTHNINIKVHEMYIDNNMHDGVPGTILEITNGGITIKTINSAIVITYIQFPNKKIISSADAFNSYLEFFTN